MTRKYSNKIYIIGDILSNAKNTSSLSQIFSGFGLYPHQYVKLYLPMLLEKGLIQKKDVVEIRNNMCDGYIITEKGRELLDSIQKVREALG